MKADPFRFSLASLAVMGDDPSGQLCGASSQVLLRSRVIGSGTCKLAPRTRPRNMDAKSTPWTKSGGSLWKRQNPMEKSVLVSFREISVVTF